MVISDLRAFGTILVKYTLKLQINFLPTRCIQSEASFLEGVTGEHQNDSAGRDRAELVQRPVPGAVSLPQDTLTASMISGSETA